MSGIAFALDFEILLHKFYLSKIFLSIKMYTSATESILLRCNHYHFCVLSGHLGLSGDIYTVELHHLKVLTFCKFCLAETKTKTPQCQGHCTQQPSYSKLSGRLMQGFSSVGVQCVGNLFLLSPHTHGGCIPGTREVAICPNIANR